MRKRLLFCSAAAIFLFAFITSCSKTPSKPSKPVLKVGQDKIKVQLMEYEAQALPYWLENGASGRTAIIFSAIDGLKPVQDNTLKELKKLNEEKDYKLMAQKIDSAHLYGSESTAWLARELGAASEVYWVVPVFGKLSENDLEGFKDFMKKQFPDQEKEIDGLSLVGNFATGTINGVPLRITSIEDMPEIKHPVLLHIDLSYLTALYKGEKKTRMLSFISGFFANIRDRKLTSDMVSVSASNADGFVPLKFRFLTSYLNQLFSDPKIIESQPPSLWTDRAEAWKTDQVSFNDAIPIYKDIIKNHPDDAASHYDLSYAYFQTGDMESCRKELAEAAKLDPVYKMGYMDYASVLQKGGKKDDAEKFIAYLSK